MKLHLPKALLTAVLAMCVAPATWATSDDTANSGWGKITTTNNNQTVPATNSYAIGDATIQSIDTTDSSSTDSTLFIRSNNGVSSATVENFIIGAGDTAKIDGWYNENVDHPEFSNLTIKNLTFNNSSLYVESANKVQVNALSGTAKEITVNGSLSVGTAGVSQIISVSDKISVGAGGTLTVDGGTLKLTATDDKTLTAANAEIIVNKGAVLQLVDTDTIDYSASNMKITLDGGELALGATRQTLGHTTLTLKDGKVTSLKADNTACFGDNYGALDINQTDSAIVSSGTSSIQGGVRLRTTGKFNVIDGTLTVDSIFNGNNSGSGIIKEGLGTLKITSMASNAQSEAFYIGSTEMRGGAIEYALTSTGAYAGTISGRGDIINSGSGTVTLSKVSNLDGNITVSAGVLNITSLAANKTMGVNVAEGAALNIGSISLNQVYGDLQLDAVSATYSDNSAGTSTANGFRTGEVVLRLFDGYEWEGTIAGYDVSVQDGDTLVTTNAGDSSSTYYVNEGTHKISDGSDYVKERAQGYNVAKDANLVIDGSSGSLTAAQLLTGTLGDGNITIGTNITLGNNTATQVTGGLTIESGKTLQVGQGTGHSSTIASFSSVKLDGGTLKFHNNGSTVHNLTVSKESTLHVQDMNAAGSIILLDDTTTLDAKLNVTSGYKGTLQIAKLTGTGDLDIKAGNNPYNDTLRVNIDALDSYTGKISYTASAWGSGSKTHNILTIKSEKDFALSGLNVLAGKSGENYTTASAVIEAKGKADLGDVKVTNGSSVTLRRNNGRFYVVMDSLAVEGSATIQTADGEASNKSYETEFSIGKLVGTDATLKLRSGSNTSAATVFNLNGGEGSNFSGAIEVGGYNNGDECKAVLNINDSTIASNAEIRFNAENVKNTAYLALGADNVAVKGISDVAGAAQIVSGEVAVGTTDVKSDDTVRTLTINTQGNSYSTAAKIDKNINLVKSGEGTQTFSGDVSAFNGSVTVKEGELALTGTSTLSLNQLSLFDTTNATGGTLSVGSANDGTVSIVSAGEKVGSVIVGKDSFLNGNLTLGAGTALTLNGYGDNAATINGTLTLGTGMQVSGLEQLLNDLAAQEAGTDGLKSLKLFNVTEVDFGTVEATLAMAADALVEEQPLIAGYDASNYFSTLSVGEYALVFQNSALYIQATAPIPEPTTATLSLLALTALAARRRRK